MFGCHTRWIPSNRIFYINTKYSVTFLTFFYSLPAQEEFCIFLRHTNTIKIPLHSTVRHNFQFKVSTTTTTTRIKKYSYFLFITMTPYSDRLNTETSIPYEKWACNVIVCARIACWIWIWSSIMILENAIIFCAPYDRYECTMQKKHVCICLSFKRMYGIHSSMFNIIIIFHWRLNIVCKCVDSVYV